MDLEERKCEPCRGETAPLKEAEARALLDSVPGWEFTQDTKKIRRRIKLKNFKDAVALVNRVAELAESEGHHPDIRIHGWNKVDLTLYTHKIGGLHENDFIMAAKFNRLHPQES